MGIKKSRKTVVLSVVAVLVVVAVAGFAGFQIHKSAKLSACKNVVKQIVGNDYAKIKSLNCSLQNVDIGNSDLIAQAYKFDAGSGDHQGCLDPGMVGGRYDSYCASGNGVILSDGRIFKHLTGNSVVAPKGTDPCYGVNKGNIEPTIRDLYFYNEQLYDRNVYKDVKIELFDGVCTLNGTSLYREGLTSPADINVTRETITNVTASYSGFTGDCINSGDKSYYFNGFECAVLFTAVSENTEYCFNNAVMITGPMRGEFEKPGERAEALRQSCTDAYVERKATLDKCADIGDGILRITCQEKTTHPAPGVTRVRSL